MKKILTIFAISLMLSGCGSSDNSENPAKNSTNDTGTAGIEISLGQNKWIFNLPKSWEKMESFPEKGVIFLARQGTQNIAITHENDFSENLIERLLETTKKSLSIFEEISKTEDSAIFRGKLSATTPMREFHQKVLVGPNRENFLLISCSQEVSNLDILDCPDILNSVYLSVDEE